MDRPGQPQDVCTCNRSGQVMPKSKTSVQSASAQLAAVGHRRQDRRDMNFGKARNNKGRILRLTVDVKFFSIRDATDGWHCKSDSAISHVTAMQYVSEVLSIEEHRILPVERHQRQLGDSSIKHLAADPPLVSGPAAFWRLALHFICDSGSRYLPTSAGSAGLHHAQKACAVKVAAEPQHQQKHRRKAAPKLISQRQIVWVTAKQ